MDALPFAFYETIAQKLPTYEWLTECGTLPGVIGAVAKDYLENEATFEMNVKNGKIEKEEHIYSHRTAEHDSRETRKKYLYRSAVFISDTPNEEPGEDPSCDKLPEIVKNTNVTVCLESSEISKGSERLVQSIKFLSFLHIEVPKTEKMQRILEIVVQKKTLIGINFHCNCKFNKYSTKALLDLLKQDQFWKAHLSENCRLSLKKVIAEWKRNSHKMAGKHLKFKTNLEGQLGALGFTTCELQNSEKFSRFLFPRGPKKALLVAYIEKNSARTVLEFR